MKKTQKTETGIPDALIDAVYRRLASNQPVRRTLPEEGRLHVDRQLPFLCVYRRPPEREDAGTDKLVNTQAAYMIAPGHLRYEKQVSQLVRSVVESMTEEFGACMVVELWAAPDAGRSDAAAERAFRPAFVVHEPEDGSADRTVDVLQARLAAIKVLKQRVTVEVLHDGASHPPEFRPLLSADEARALNCTTIGLAVPPVYRSVELDLVFPPLLRSLRRSVGLALRQMFFAFTSSHTTRSPAHFHVMGRRAVVKAVWEIDQRLADVSDAFDYLLLLNPVNSRDAYRAFERTGFEKVPPLHYRPLPIDPALLKRKLYNIPIERVEDPALQHLFQEKREELELKITMLRDRDTPQFLHQSLQLFGPVDDDLFALATSVLEHLPPRSTPSPKTKRVDAQGFAECARAEFEFYRQQHPDFVATARITKDVTGLIVSRGGLLINKELSVPESRVEALVAHEVGTHLLTYYNGLAQPFRQLYSGLAGYEELQEGLAVLSEYLVGGLNRDRMRLLAARVVAARHLVEGAAFVDTFKVLNQTYGFANRTAYTTTMRVYRGGGLTKDAIYLRGLRSVVRYVSKGGELRPLFVGKIALSHMPIIRELAHREVLKPTPIEPRYLSGEDSAKRLSRLRDGDGSVLQLVDADESA